MSMEIDTQPGGKVRFAHPEAGWRSDQDVARERLTVGAMYTLKSINVGQSETRVMLREVPGVSFNSVLFDNAR